MIESMLTPIIFILIVFVSFFFAFYSWRLMSYLKKNKLDRYRYLFGSFPDFPYQNVTPLRAWRWLYSNMDRDDQTIQKYKTIIVICQILAIILTIIWIVV